MAPGKADFTVGGRVQFTDTDKKRHIYNGNAGMITGIDVSTGRVTARLDAPVGAPGREVTWDAVEFDSFRHGYAGTIYKGQGKTLDHTYLLPTHHGRAAASYVALTRQWEGAMAVQREAESERAQGSVESCGCEGAPIGSPASTPEGVTKRGRLTLKAARAQADLFIIGDV